MFPFIYFFIIRSSEMFSMYFHVIFFIIRSFENVFHAFPSARCKIHWKCRLQYISQSEIYRRGNVENDWNLSVVFRSPSKAIIGFSIISDYFQCRKYRFPDVGHRRKCQGFCSLKSSEFQLKHALRNSLSMYFYYLTNIGTNNGLTLVFHH